MTKRQFLKLGALSYAALNFPNLLMANSKKLVDLYGPPGIIIAMAAVAKERGKIKSECEFNIKRWKSPDELRAGLANKSIQISMSPSNLGVVLNNKGWDMKLVNILTDGLLSVVSRNKDVKSLKDLEGAKMVCMFKGDMPDLVMQSVMKANNINLDISYVNSPSEAMSLFLAAKYDAAVLAEPLTTVAIFKSKMALSKGEVFRNFNLVQEFEKAFGMNCIPQAGLIATAEFYNENKELIKTLNDDMKDALEYIKNEPKKSAKITSNYMDAPAKAIEMAFPFSNLTVRPALEYKDIIMAFYKIMFEMDPKILGGKLPKDDFFV